MKPFKRISEAERAIRETVVQDPTLVAAGEAMAKGMPAASVTAIAPPAETISPLAPAQEAINVPVDVAEPKAENTHVDPRHAGGTIAYEFGKMYEVGTVVEAQPSEVIENQYNARRTPPTKGQLDKRLKSWQTDGQLVPVLGYQTPDTRIHLFDGHVRRVLATLTGTKLRIELREPPAHNRELYLKSRAANVERGNQSPIDDALAWDLLLKDGVFASQAELSRELGISETTMSRVRNLNTLPARVVEMLGMHPDLLENLRMLDALRQYCDAFGESSTEALIIDIERDDLAARDVDARRLNKSREKKTRERSEIQNHKFEKGHATLKQFDAGRRMVFELEGLHPEVPMDVLAKALHDAVANYLK